MNPAERTPEVLHRDAQFLVLSKPSGLPTTGPGPARTLVDVAHELDPRAERLHPSSRLDAEVSGVVIFARTAVAIAWLLEARSAEAYQRGYLALSARAPTPRQGQWNVAIAIDGRDHRKRVAAPAATSAGAGSAREARSRYRTLGELPQSALLWLEPLTGRTHQLRVHAAHAGVPLLGDRHYGGATRVVLSDGRVLGARRTMLHCARVCVPNPAGGTPLCFEAPLPADLRLLWSALGGEEISLPRKMGEDEPEGLTS